MSLSFFSWFPAAARPAFLVPLVLIVLCALTISVLPRHPAGGERTGDIPSRIESYSPLRSSLLLFPLFLLAALEAQLLP